MPDLYGNPGYSGGGGYNLGQRAAGAQIRRGTGAGARGRGGFGSGVGALGPTAGTDIPVSGDLDSSPGSSPTAQNIDPSGGIPPDRSQPTMGGPGSNYPTEASQRYQQLIENAPEPARGVRGVLGTVVSTIGGLANQPAIANLGTRLSWKANPNTPGGPSTPDAYNATLARARLASQLAESTQQTRFMDQYRQSQLAALQDARSARIQDVQQAERDRQQNQFNQFQQRTEAVDPIGNRVMPTPTSVPISGSLSQAPGAPPAPPTTPPTDPGTGAVRPVYPGASTQGQMLTRTDPSTGIPETRLQPSQATLAARKAMEGKSPLSPEDQVLAQSIGYPTNVQYSAEDLRDMRKAATTLANKPEKEPKTPDVQLQLLQSDVDAQALKEGKKPGIALSALSPAGQQAVQTAYKARQASPDAGSWQIAEDADGKPILFNTKTSETRPAPGGVQRSGTAEKTRAALAKETEPIDTATNYATDYLKSGMFTAAKDEALMEKYFEIAKPSTGFRMTQPQIDMLTKGRSLVEGGKANLAHALTPEAPYFSTTQRQQIVDAMNDLAKAKRGAIAIARGGGAATSTAPAPTPGTPGPANDPMGVRQLIKTGR